MLRRSCAGLHFIFARLRHSVACRVTQTLGPKIQCHTSTDVLHVIPLRILTMFNLLYRRPLARSCLLALAVLVMMTTQGCASSGSLRVSDIDAVGEYVQTDRFAGEVVVLKINADHTFVVWASKCWGGHGSAKGTWRSEGDKVVFTELEGRMDFVGYLKEAEWTNYEGKIGLARDQDVKEGRIDEKLVFFKRAIGKL